MEDIVGLAKAERDVSKDDDVTIGKEHSMYISQQGLWMMTMNSILRM